MDTNTVPKPNKVVLQRLKGTQDVLPLSVADVGQPALSIHLWQQLEQLLHQYFQAANYQEIRTPSLEYTELFARGVGEATDIVTKEMFTFERSDRSLTLRPEGTAGVVRAFVENGLSRQPKPVKLYYCGPMFRYERPQEGRQRQFHQVGLELLGLDTPAADAESILMAAGLFRALGLPQEAITLRINNVGLPEDRALFRDALKALLFAQLPQLCDTCQARYEKNPLRMLDCKVPSCQAIYRQDTVSDFLRQYPWPDSSRVPFEQLLVLLNEMGVSYVHDPYLVRGLDYYTRTVFEFTTDRLGAQNAVCGGGRYNQLVETLGGPPTPSVGWAIGVERLLRLMTPLPPARLDVFVCSQDIPAAFRVAEHLRAAGLRVEVDLSERALGKQLAQASKRQARWALIRGESEQQADEWQLKHLDRGTQQTVASLPDPQVFFAS